MYRAYIFVGHYTFIEKKRRIVTAITYLSIGESVCFNLFLPWKHIVSTGETNGNKLIIRYLDALLWSISYVLS